MGRGNSRPNFMADIVRPLKIEDDNQFDMIPTETNPLEDAIATKGVYLESSPTHSIERTGDQVFAQDGDLPVAKDFKTLAHNSGPIVVPSADRAWVLSDQQTILLGELTVEGEMFVEGYLAIDEIASSAQFPEDNYSHKVISVGELRQIPSGQQMFIVDTGPMIIDGDLVVDGELVLDQIQDTVIPPFPPLPEDNFSYRSIATSTTTTIPVNQQMIVDGLLEIDGELRVEGQLSVLDDRVDDGNPPYIMNNGERYLIPTKKQMFLAVPFILDGTIEIEGVLVLGA